MQLAVGHQLLRGVLYVGYSALRLTQPSLHSVYSTTVCSVALILLTSVKRVSRLAFCSGRFGLASLEPVAAFPRAGLKYFEVDIPVPQMAMSKVTTECS